MKPVLQIRREGSVPVKVIILYHANCLDGFAAASVAWDYFHETHGDNLVMVPMAYNTPIPWDLMKDNNVYMLDYSRSPEEILPRVDELHRLTILDHHENAMKAWVDLGSKLFDYNMLVQYEKKHSGAAMAWNFFHPQPTDYDMVPLVIKHCQDHDLWNFDMDNTREIISGLCTKFPFDEQNFAGFAKLFRHFDAAEYASIGAAVIPYEKRIINNIIRDSATVVTFAGYDGVPFCPCPYQFASRVGERLGILYPTSPFSVTYEDHLETGERQYSLRSRKTDGVLVDAIAKLLGGNGHDHAAGAIVKMKFAL